MSDKVEVDVDDLKAIRNWWQNKEPLQTDVVRRLIACIPKRTVITDKAIEQAMRARDGYIHPKQAIQLLQNLLDAGAIFPEGWTEEVDE